MAELPVRHHMYPVLGLFISRAQLLGFSDGV